MSLGMLEHLAKDYFYLIPKDSEKIPSVLIKSSDIVKNTSYYLKKLDSKDPRAAFLGKLTDCCQSIDHPVGRQFVIHGITQPDSGFYVICKQKGPSPSPSDEIVSQAWAWRENEALVLDSIESLKLNLSGKVKKTNITNSDMWNAMYQRLAVTLVGQQGISIVMVGWGGYDHTSRGIGVEATNNYSSAASHYTIHDNDDIAIRHSDSATKMILAMEYIPLSELHKLQDGGKYFIGTEAEREHAQEKIMLFIHSENALKRICELKSYCNSSEIVTIVNFFQSFYKSQHDHPTVATEVKSKNDDNLWSAIMAQPTPLLTINWTEWLLEYLRISNPISQKTVETFLRDKIDRNAKNKFGDIIGTLAIKNGSQDLINYFLKCNLFENESSALMYAIQLGKIEIVECWLNRPVDFGYLDGKNDTPLTLAVQNGKFDIAAMLIRHNNFHYSYILLLLSDNNKIETMQWLVEQPGIDLNKTDLRKANRDSATLLIEAVTKHKLNLVQLLVQQPGINLNQTNYDGFTALQLAIYTDNLEIVKCLADQPTIEINPDVLIYAVNNEQWDIVRYFANHPKIDLNRKRISGENALEFAQLNANVPQDVLALLNPKKHELKQAQKHSSPSVSEKVVKTSDSNSTELHRTFLAIREKGKNGNVKPAIPPKPTVNVAVVEWQKRAQEIKERGAKVPANTKNAADGVTPQTNNKRDAR